MQNKKLFLSLGAIALVVGVSVWGFGGNSNLFQGYIGVKPVVSLEPAKIGETIKLSIVKSDPNILTSNKDILKLSPSVVLQDSAYKINCRDFMSTMADSPDLLELLKQIRTGKVSADMGTSWILRSLDFCEPNHFEQFNIASPIAIECNSLYFKLGQGGLTNSEKDALVAKLAEKKCFSDIALTYSGDCSEIRDAYKADTGNEITRGKIAYALAKNNCSECIDDFAQIFYNYGSRSERSVHMTSIDENAECSVAGVVPEDATCADLEQLVTYDLANGSDMERIGKYYYALLKKGCRPFDN